ncbi:MAG: 3'-5' exonuclease [Campylobacter sp.]|nr:3'-5' exonuclease [Campylobacter sp.]
MGYICVFDTETTPDTAALRATYGYDGSDEEVANIAFEKQLEKSGGVSSFLPVCFHKIVCISAVMADEYGRFDRVSTMKGDSEKEQLEQFLGFLNSYNPRLISFNGKGFDMPMIMVRAMKYNLSCPAYYEIENRELNKNKWENYRYRYNERFHTDLLDQISDYGAVRGLKLDEVCKTIGAPGKFDTKGDEVTVMYYRGEIEAIKTYCESDTLNTYWLFIKFELLRGNISLEDYANNLSLMSEFLQSQKSEVSYTKVFCDTIAKELESIKNRL